MTTSGSKTMLSHLKVKLHMYPKKPRTRTVTYRVDRRGSPKEAHPTASMSTHADARARTRTSTRARHAHAVSLAWVPAPTAALAPWLALQPMPAPAPAPAPVSTPTPESACDEALSGASSRSPHAIRRCPLAHAAATPIHTHRPTAPCGPDLSDSTVVLRTCDAWNLGSAVGVVVSSLRMKTFAPCLRSMPTRSESW